MPAGLINRSARRSHELKSAKVHIHEEHSTGRHLPCQPRQLSWVRMTGSRSCMPKMRPRKNPLVVLGLIKRGTAKPALVDEHKPLSRLPVNQACVLSVNRCRAACRETPRATATWFHDLSCARANLTASRSRASSARTASETTETRWRGGWCLRVPPNPPIWVLWEG